MHRMDLRMAPLLATALLSFPACVKQNGFVSTKQPTNQPSNPGKTPPQGQQQDAQTNKVDIAAAPAAVPTPQIAPATNVDVGGGAPPPANTIPPPTSQPDVESSEPLPPPVPEEDTPSDLPPEVPVPSDEGGETPLVFDLDGNGSVSILLSGAKPVKVPFDIAGSGALTSIETIDPRDGFLAIDLNHNGKIDSGRELFGSATMLTKLGNKAHDGFEALKQYDDHNGVIDERDGVFSSLLIWRDLNANGVSENDELKSLADLGITAISLFHVSHVPPLPLSPAATTVAAYEGQFTLRSGKTGKIVDVVFSPSYLLAHGGVK